MKCLLDHGACIGYRSPTGSTALIKAVGSRNVESVKVLLESKADSSFVTQSGISALKVAELMNESAIVDVLRENLGS